MYGLTECAGAVTGYPKGLDPRPGCCGQLLPNTEAKVWDPDTNRNLGPDQPGELCFKGPMTMKGYVKDPENTKNAFDEEGFLHTGDIGYYDEEGFFYIIDRSKDLIKYKGFQVPPIELETILLSHPAVKEAAVVGKPDERAGEIPVGFIVRHSGSEVTEQELLDLVSENVSVQKRLYGGIQFVAELPKNSTGKIMKKTLRDLLNGSDC